MRNNSGISAGDLAPMRPRGAYADKAVHDAIARYQASAKGQAALKRARSKYQESAKGRAALKRARDKYRGVEAQKRRAKDSYDAERAAEIDAERAARGLPPVALRVVNSDGTETPDPFFTLGL